jgi:hypothetical protein
MAELGSERKFEFTVHRSKSIMPYAVCGTDDLGQTSGCCGLISPYRALNSAGDRVAGRVHRKPKSTTTSIYYCGVFCVAVELTERTVLPKSGSTSILRETFEIVGAKSRCASR